MEAVVDKLCEPLRAMNKVTVHHTEKLATLQISNIEQSIKFVVEQLKNIIAVKDPTSFNQFIKEQTTITKEFIDRVVNDSNTIVKLGKSYTSEVHNVIRLAIYSKN